MQCDAERSGTHAAFARHQVKRFLFTLANTHDVIGLMMRCLGRFCYELNGQAMMLRHLDGRLNYFSIGNSYFVHFYRLSMFSGHVNILDNIN